MQFNNRQYPLPVWGIDDDFIKGEFTVDLSVRANSEDTEITPIFKLDIPEINELVQAGLVTYLCHVYCRGTFYREIFMSQRSISETIIIPSSSLKGDVELDFFICALHEHKDYSSKYFHPEYSNATFNLDKGDIIAYGGKGIFYANKHPEDYKKISALMHIACSQRSREPMYLDYSGKRITLMLSTEDYRSYKIIKSNKDNIGVLLSAIVLPALVEALHFLNNPDAEEFKDQPWFKSLQKIKENSKRYSDPIRIAQHILELPINRCFAQFTEEASDE